MAVTAAFDQLRQIARPLWHNRMLRRVGIALLAGLSLIFLVSAFIEAGSAAVLSAIGWVQIGGIVASGLAYGILLVLLARSWALAPGAGATGMASAIAVYGTSILPKYIPGSVLQYGSRQVLGRQLGWDGGLMARGSLLEVALHVICSLLVALVLLLPVTHLAQGGIDGWLIAAIVVALIVSLGALTFVAQRLPLKTLVGSACYQLVFFAGMAALAAGCGALFGVGAEHLPLVGSMFLLSWLIGFVVPLAPGGIGVREASGVALLSGTIGVEAALLVLAGMRLVSLIGDVLLFIAGVAAQRALRLRR